MPPLETELERAPDLAAADLADAIEAIALECTDCGACCRSEERTDGEVSTSGGRNGSTDAAGVVRAHECEGLGRDIDRDEAESLAAALKARAVRELEEVIAVRNRYEPARPDPGEVVVHDSEGPRRPDGRPSTGCGGDREDVGHGKRFTGGG